MVPVSFDEVESSKGEVFPRTLLLLAIPRTEELSLGLHCECAEVVMKKTARLA